MRQKNNISQNNKPYVQQTVSTIIYNKLLNYAKSKDSNSSNTNDVNTDGSGDMVACQARFTGSHA